MPTTVINEYQIWIHLQQQQQLWNDVILFSLPRKRGPTETYAKTRLPIIVVGSVRNLYKYNIILYDIQYKTATSSITFTLFWLAPIGLCGYKRDYISLQGRRGPGTI